MELTRRSLVSLFAAGSLLGIPSQKTVSTSTAASIIMTAAKA